MLRDFRLAVSRIGIRLAASRRVSGGKRYVLPLFAFMILIAPLPAAERKGGGVTEEAKKYWCYQPIKRPAQPEIVNKSWAKSPIDAFILAKLEAKNLTPAGPAEPIALIRRVTYDLTGLPPTPEEVDAFTKEFATAPQAACEKLVDRLLASPHYGEKWARHWLDLVRYAETNGYERDGPKPHAWRFRDYVIRSFNADKPYDRFIKEQLAGDELDRNDPDCIIATGYYRLGLWDDEPADRELARFDELDDWVATTSQVFLGMTMNCARCHEHKIDPIPHADYYRMLAFFQDVRRYDPNPGPRSAGLTDITPAEKRQVYEAELAMRQERIQEIVQRMTAIEEGAIKKMPAEDQRASEGAGRPDVVKKVPTFLKNPLLGEYLRLRKEADGLRRAAPASQELALSVNNCIVQPPGTTIQLRGNPRAPGAAVEPGFPQVLGFPDPKFAPPAKAAKSSGRRLGARQLDRLQGKPADRPRDRQPRLAAPPRPRHCPHPQRLRQIRRATDPPRTARLVGG